MKKILLGALAVFALASCAKNEVVSIADAPHEIIFQNIVNPSTKADTTPLSDSLKFRVFAYYIPEGGNSSDATLYMDNALIGYVDGKWKCVDRTYYWPKNGSLEFHAWTDMTSDVVVSGVSCDPFFSIQIERYSTKEYPNKELYVSNPCSPEKNTVVPIVFKPILAKFSFSISLPENVQSDEESDVESIEESDEDDSETDLNGSDCLGSTIILDSIAFKNLATYGDYSWYARDVVDWEQEGRDGYTTWKSEYTPLYTSSTGLEINGSVDLKPNPGDYYIVLPQRTWSSDWPYLRVVYRIKSDEAEEKVVSEVAVKEFIPYDSIWGEPNIESGRHYHINIKLSLDDIEFAPTVKDYIYHEVTLDKTYNM